MDVWGDLPKSQVDPATIDDEIDTKIDTHLADPDAHLETGQSLQSHKASEIIDHVVGSVLSDKLSMTELSYITIFESLTGWNIKGDVTNDDFPGCRVYVEYGAVDESSAYTQPQVPVNFLSNEKDLLCQVMCRFSLSYTTFYAWLGFIYGETSTDNLMGFQVRNGALYTHFYDGVYLHSTLISGVNLENDNIFRVQYNKTSKKITWYINGSEVDSYVFTGSNNWNYDLGPAFGLKITGENDGALLIASINFSIEI